MFTSVFVHIVTLYVTYTVALLYNGPLNGTVQRCEQLIFAYTHMHIYICIYTVGINIVYTTYVCMYLPRLGMVCVAYGVEGVFTLLCWCRWVLCWAMRLHPDCHKSHKAVLGYCLYVRYCDMHGYVWELCEEEVGSCEVDLPPLLAVYKRHRTMNNFSLPLSLCKWVGSTC